MILESIELEHIGPFRGKATVGPLRTGLNLLAAPNESGKSTFLRAAVRALFDKHTCKDGEILALRPAGSDLAPRIAVVFEHGGSRYRVEKQFLTSPKSTISEWNGGWSLLAEADAADERVQKLLQSTVPGRGATKSAHWGMLGFLWARQGEPSTWPEWEGECGHAIQTRLARVEIDPVIEHLRESLWMDYTGLFTDTGKPKKHGALDQLQAELAKAEGELREVTAARVELGTLERQFAEIGPRRAELEREFTANEAMAAELRALAVGAELTMREVEQRQGEYDTAAEKLTAISADDQQLQKWDEESTLARADTESAKLALVVATEKEVEAGKLAAVAEAESESVAVRMKELVQNVERTAGLLSLRRAEMDRDKAKKQAGKVAKEAGRVREIQTQLMKLPEITSASLKKLTELQEAIRANEAKLAAIGLAIELSPATPAKVTVNRDGEVNDLTLGAGSSETIHGAQNVELQLAGWGRIKIKSGAAELGTLRDELDADRKRLRDRLADASCASLTDAETAVSLRRELQNDLKAAEEKLADALDEFDSTTELDTHCATAERRVATLRDAFSLSADEAKLTIAELEADAERDGIALKQEQNSQTASSQSLKKFREAAGKCSSERERADKSATKNAAAAAALEQQMAALRARYSKGLAEAKREAQDAFVKAEARLVAAKAKLPEDASRLPERNKRAAAACEQVRLDLDACRRKAAQLEGALQTRGAEGLYSKESSLIERIETLQRETASLRTHGWAARLAHDLIQFRKQAATRSVLGPLEERLSAMFGEVTRDTTRRVFLDEHLQIAGTGSTRDAMIAFEHLSQGAREQLLLCLRLAVAAEVSQSGHRLVVLDDVLVNTDLARQQRVLDLLQSAPADLQILILTCHADRYRGIGERIEIRIEP